MSDHDVEVELVRVHVHGSRFEHLAALGGAITLCACGAYRPSSAIRKRELCRRCAREASQRGLVIPK